MLKYFRMISSLGLFNIAIYLPTKRQLCNLEEDVHFIYSAAALGKHRRLTTRFVFLLFHGAVDEKRTSLVLTKLVM